MDERRGVESRHWSEATARALLREWEERGGSLRAFARERGLGVRRLYWWRQRLSARKNPMSGAKRRMHAKPPMNEAEVRLAPAVLLPAPSSMATASAIAAQLRRAISSG